MHIQPMGLDISVILKHLATTKHFKTIVLSYNAESGWLWVEPVLRYFTQTPYAIGNIKNSNTRKHPGF